MSSSATKTTWVADINKNEFVRKPTTFRNWIKRDGSTEFKPELNRYHLYVSYACPWAHRALVVRILKGLEHVISYSTVHWFLEEGGWKFTKEYPDPHHSEDFTHLKNVYTLSDPNYDGNITVPVLFDLKTQKIVNNESSEIIRMLNSEFNEYAKNSLDLYPEQLRSQIDSINDEVYPKLNNGVYRAGFAKNQEAYESAFNDVFYMLDKIEAILSKQRYLVDNKILTEADIRLWTTLIRFDPVYVTHFKCNKYLVTKDYPNIYGYMCEIYQMNGIKETVNMFHIKNHYFQSHTHINPTKIVPLGPEIDYTKPHKRDKF